jgi:regulator of sirC expression with transglutaminase-like and TPR domain
MTREEAEQSLRDAAAFPDGRFPLFEAALACAAHDNPAREVEPVRALAHQIAERLADRLRSESAEEAVAETLSGDFRFTGDVLTPDDPANADLIAVAERRRGLSAVLGVFYLDAARRCGVPLDGVDFPGHFLLRIDSDQGPLALDPFAGGRVVLPSELSRRALRAGLTPAVAEQLELLMAPVDDRAVLIRLQNVIFARAQRAGDFPRAERAALRRALLDPSDHRAWIDVAAAREGQGALAGALEALGRAQQLDGGAAVAAMAARERVRLKLN